MASASQGDGRATANFEENPERPDDYIRWKVLPKGDGLNRWSHNITNGHDFPGSRVRRFFSSFPSGVTAP